MPSTGALLDFSTARGKGKFDQAVVTISPYEAISCGEEYKAGVCFTQDKTSTFYGRGPAGIEYSTASQAVLLTFGDGTSELPQCSLKPVMTIVEAICGEGKNEVRLLRVSSFSWLVPLSFHPFYFSSSFFVRHRATVVFTSLSGKQML